MTNNTQLPAEVLEEIKLSAIAFAAGMWPGETKQDAKQREYVAAVHEAGATEYATRLHEARTLIEKMNAIYGHLHPVTLANKIKTFLDGTK